MSAEGGSDQEARGFLHKDSKGFRFLFFTGLGLGFLGFLTWAGYIALKVATGQGLDYYWTGWGVRFNYIGALVLIICAGLIGLAAPVLYWWGTRHERDFKRKYGIDDRNT
jgi:uncharacterized BrkB/YihY/UPF0761 family membrane protein